MPFDHDELSANANGGAEMMGRLLERHLDRELFECVHIIRSRVRSISPTLPNILWLHDLPNDPEAVKLADPQWRSQFARLVFVSEWQQREYNRVLGVPFREGTVIRNAIELSGESASKVVEGKASRKDQLRLIYHTTPHRGLELLAMMVGRLGQDLPNARIRLDVFSSFEAYGWSERDEPYRGLFEWLRSHPWVRYHGWQPNDVVVDHLREAHAFVYPCIWPETSCIAAIEALAYGCDVWTTDLGALPETVYLATGRPNDSIMLVRHSTNMQELIDDFYNECLLPRVTTTGRASHHAAEAANESTRRRISTTETVRAVYNHRRFIDDWTRLITKIKG